MTTIPGTHFTKEQLEADRKVDNVTAEEYSGSSLLTQYGFVYKNERKQYDKALAWYILAAMKRNCTAQNNIGTLYRDGLGVPQNYLCALKWQLKSVEQKYVLALRNIGELFENGRGIPLDKNKALEWYRHGGYKAEGDKLKKEGFHRSALDKKKPLERLIEETKAILDTEKKKLEEKQQKTQEEIVTLEQLNIAYKLADDGEDAWSDVPILISEDYQHSIKSVDGSVVNYKDEIQVLMKQLLEQEKSAYKGQTKMLPPLKQAKANFELQIMEKDNKIISLESNMRSLQQENSTTRHQLKTHRSKINTLQSENQELKKEKDTYEHQIKEKDNKISSLKNEKHIYHSSYVEQMQTMERLRTSYAALEQLLKSKDDVIVSLSCENNTLSTATQGNQHGTNEMMETLKRLLEAKSNELELNKSNMRLVLDKEKKRNKKLQREIEMLKQKQQHTQPSIATSSNNIAVPGSNTSYDYINNSNKVNSNINYDTECGTEDSAGDSSEDGGNHDDINYDTPDESEDAHEDLK